MSHWISNLPNKINGNIFSFNNVYWHVINGEELEISESDLLSDFEKLEYSLLNNLQRKKEYLNARFALKQLYNYLNIDYRGTKKDSNGKIFCNANSGNISISHSNNIIIVAFSFLHQIGVDIEVNTHRLSKVKTKFLSSIELKNVSDTNLPFYWTAKESIYKLVNQPFLSFTDDIQINFFENSKTGTALVNNYKKIDLFFNDFNKIIYCVCIL